VADGAAIVVVVVVVVVVAAAAGCPSHSERWDCCHLHGQ